ncbi:hypothetical protein LTS08_001241 [Lithohypha guttulata]|uniref:Uncharacterized protein n=1 Tax=Lithohypha guttulata TaxID=1690604 RepID=A0AAN7SU83_9EURO|nr:hypothetical protein LTR51_007758 [Lithohypha guttulata]KAK5081662.1 hypothetical protein LTR05_007795 [Lithohypha guttulata]KAK5104968.1 hypothetical protein LTS08_001241 [Lithohypha guttulata]
MSGLVNKAKGMVGSQSAKHDTQHGSTNAGPHNSNIANKLDPRVDSDFDHRENPGSIVGGYGKGQAQGPFETTNQPYDTHYQGTAGSGNAPSTAGPHNKDMLNKADPRVDSDRDHSTTLGGNKTHT